MEGPPGNTPAALLVTRTGRALPKVHAGARIRGRRARPPVREDCGRGRMRRLAAGLGGLILAPVRRAARRPRRTTLPCSTASGRRSTRASTIRPSAAATGGRSAQRYRARLAGVRDDAAFRTRGRRDAGRAEGLAPLPVAADDLGRLRARGSACETREIGGVRTIVEVAALSDAWRKGLRPGDMLDGRARGAARAARLEATVAVTACDGRCADGRRAPRARLLAAGQAGLSLVDHPDRALARGSATCASTASTTARRSSPTRPWPTWPRPGAWSSTCAATAAATSRRSGSRATSRRPASGRRWRCSPSPG